MSGVLDFSDLAPEKSSTDRAATMLPAPKPTGLLNFDDLVPKPKAAVDFTKIPLIGTALDAAVGILEQPARAVITGGQALGASLHGMAAATIPEVSSKEGRAAMWQAMFIPGAILGSPGGLLGGVAAGSTTATVALGYTGKKPYAPGASWGEIFMGEFEKAHENAKDQFIPITPTGAKISAWIGEKFGQALQYVGDDLFAKGVPFPMAPFIRTPGTQESPVVGAAGQTLAAAAAMLVRPPAFAGKPMSKMFEKDAKPPGQTPPKGEPPLPQTPEEIWAGFASRYPETVERYQASNVGKVRVADFAPEDRTVFDLISRQLDRELGLEAEAKTMNVETKMRMAMQRFGPEVSASEIDRAVLALMSGLRQAEEARVARAQIGLPKIDEPAISKDPVVVTKDGVTMTPEQAAASDAAFQGMSVQERADALGLSSIGRRRLDLEALQAAEASGDTKAINRARSRLETNWARDFPWRDPAKRKEGLERFINFGGRMTWEEAAAGMGKPLRDFTDNKPEPKVGKGEGPYVHPWDVPPNVGRDQGGWIKQKGGNWHPDTIKELSGAIFNPGALRALQADADGMRRAGEEPTPSVVEGIAAGEKLVGWSEKAITRYLNKDMGTATDPLKDIKIPVVGVRDGVTWEKVTDSAIKAKEQGTEVNLPGVPDGDTVWTIPRQGQVRGRETYTSAETIKSWLSHVGDYLRQSESFQKDPSRYDFVRAFKETVAWDEANAKKAAKERSAIEAKRAADTSTMVSHMDFPEVALPARTILRSDRKGGVIETQVPPERVSFSWKKLTRPGEFAEEGTYMGHSVGGYEPPARTNTRQDLHVTKDPNAIPHPDWIPASGKQGSSHYGHGGWEAIKRGDAEVYSLRDSKGRSYATIEVKNHKSMAAGMGMPTIDRVLGQPIRKALGVDALDMPEITQIKGPGNGEIPREAEAYVADFLNKGKWSDVNLDQSNIVRSQYGYLSRDQVKEKRLVETSDGAGGEIYVDPKTMKVRPYNVVAGLAGGWEVYIPGKDGKGSSISKHKSEMLAHEYIQRQLDSTKPMEELLPRAIELAEKQLADPMLDKTAKEQLKYNLHNMKNKTGNWQSAVYYALDMASPADIMARSRGGYERGMIDVEGWGNTPPKRPNVRAWEVGSRDQERPMADKVQAAYDKNRLAEEEYNKVTLANIMMKLGQGIFGHDIQLKNALDKAGPMGERARLQMVLQHGATDAARFEMDRVNEAIFSKMNSEQRRMVDDLARDRRIIEIQSYNPDYKIPEGITGREAEAHARQMARELGPEKFRIINDKVDAIQFEYNKLLADRFRAGLISKESFDKLIHYEYNPTQYIDLIDPIVTYHIHGKPVSVRSSGILDLGKGKQAYVRMDTQAMLAEMIGRTRNLEFKNETLKRLWDLADTTPDNGVVAIPKKDGAHPPSGWSKLGVRIEGVQKDLLMKDVYAEQFVNTPQGISFWVGNVARVASGSAPLRATAVGYNPLFPLAGIPMDVAHIYAASAKQYSPHLPVYLTQIGMDMLKVMPDVISKKGAYAQAMREGLGAHFISDYSANIISREKTMAEVMMPTQNKIKTVLRAFNNGADIWVRLAHRNRLIEMGMDSAEATARARDRLDPVQGGELVKAVDTLIPWTNIAMQALYKVAKNAKADPKEILIKFGWVFGAYTAWNMGNMMVSPETWKAIPTRDKVSGLSITYGDQLYILDQDGQKRFFHTPLRFDQVFAPIQAISVGGLELAEYGRMPPDLIKATAQQVSTFVNPVDGIPMISASAAMMNFDTHTGKPIYRGVVEPKDETRPDTHPLAGLVGEATGTSPMRLEAATAKIISPYNPVIRGTAWALKELLGDTDYRAKARLSEQVLAENLRPIIKLTNPMSAFVDTLQDITEKDGSRRKVQTDMINKLVFGVEHKTNDMKAIQDYIASQPPEDRERLSNHAKIGYYVDHVMEHYKAGHDQWVPPKSWWKATGAQTPTVRAQEFYDKWLSADPAGRAKMEGIAKALQNKGTGYQNEAFRREFTKEQNRLGTERR